MSHDPKKQSTGLHRREATRIDQPTVATTRSDAEGPAKLLARVRLGLLACVLLAFLFSAVNLWGDSTLARERLPGQAVHVVILLLAWGSTRRWPTTRCAVGAACVGILSVLFTTLREPSTTPMAAAILALGTGAFLPWSLRAQGGAALLCSGAVMSHAAVWKSGADELVSLAAMLGIGASLLVTAEQTRRMRVVHAARWSQRVGQRLLELATRAPFQFWWLDRSADGHRAILPGRRGPSRTQGYYAYDGHLDLLGEIHPGDRDRLERETRKIFDSGLNSQYRTLDRDGAVRWIHIRAYPVADRDAPGHVTAVGFSEDVTAERAAAQAAKEREEIYAKLLEESPHAVLVFDGDAKLNRMDAVAERLLGPSATLGSRRWMHALTPPSRRTVIDGLRRGRFAGLPGTIQLELDEESFQHAEVTYRLLPREDGLQCSEIVLRDVTFQRRAEDTARLRRLTGHLEAAREGERRRVATRLHDEVAQPLTAIGLATALAEELAESAPERAVTHLSEVHEVSSEIMRTIRELIGELRPDELDHLGLAAALRRLAESVTRGRFALEHHIDDAVDECSQTVSEVVFRTVQELVKDAAEGRSATRAKLRIGAVANEIRLDFTDDGHARHQQSSADTIELVRERIAPLTGRLVTQKGTTSDNSLRIRIPLESFP